MNPALEQLTNILSGIAPMDDREIQLLASLFKPKRLKKGEFFLQSGKVAYHVGYLYSGLVRYFVYKDGEESTFEFTKEGEFIADYQSFTKKTISLQNIQAIEDAELLIIQFDGLQQLFNGIRHGNLIGRRIIEHRFDVMVSQLLAIYMQSHEERYLRFTEQYADLVQRIPQYLIASYVGVQPQSLSRIRRRFANKLS